VQKLLKFSILPILVILLTFIQVSAEEDILLELSVGEGDLLMYFVDGDNEYILAPSSISFETSNTSFDPIDVEGTFGVSSQKLRIDNATGGEVELSVALDVSDFEEDAKWIDGENSFLAYSTNGSTGGLVVDPEDIVLTDSGCGGVTNDRTLSRFTYLGSEDPGNVTSIDVLNSSGGNYCRFDITNLKLIQTIPPRTSSGDYSIGMVLTITGGYWLPGYTLSYTAGDNGSILGESIQTVSHGSDGSSVEAVADEGYEFVNWSDEVTDNPRTDTNVTENISVIANFWTCGEKFIDKRDGNKEYTTVEIGNQCWMVENLDYDDGCSSVTWENEVDKGWCGYHTDDTGQTHGLLYQWSVVMSGDSVPDEDTTTSVQGICPEGWLLPSDSEWHALESHFATDSCIGTRTSWDCSPAGDQLKDISANWCASSPCGESGFEALAAGRRLPLGSFGSFGSEAYFWTSSPLGTSSWRRGLGSSISNTGIFRFSSTHDLAISVRCLKN
jgi:uncharacterized protein (TIGR02145 family)